MDGTTFVVAIVAIFAVTSIIQTWIKNNKEDNQIERETFNKLAQAFIQHKKDMQERMENLEAIIAEENEKYEESHFSQLEDRQSEDTLSNDLQQKQKTR